MSKVLGFLRKADNEFNLIKDGDKIAVGISGGKDSIVLLKALQLYKYYSKKNYEFIGIHIKMGFENMDFNPVIDFCKKQEIDFYLEESNPPIYQVLQKNLTNQGKLPCSICSRMKKAAINDAAHKYHCNKVAFAHHGDDAVETLLLNAIYGGRLATFKPKMYLTNTELEFIRPLIYVRENDIERTASNLKLPIITSTCPNDKTTKRQDIKELLNDIYKKYPQSRENFLYMLSNIEKIQLWDKDKYKEE